MNFRVISLAVSSNPALVARLSGDFSFYFHGRRYCRIASQAKRKNYFRPANRNRIVDSTPSWDLDSRLSASVFPGNVFRSTLTFARELPIVEQSWPLSSVVPRIVDYFSIGSTNRNLARAILRSRTETKNQVSSCVSRFENITRTRNVGEHRSERKRSKES